jgi:putative endonuclease
MASHNELGKKGEEIAQSYLLDKEYRILHTNWKTGRKEIDIIAYKDDCISFIEVKTRNSSQFGWPEEAVHSRKIDLLQTAADTYLEYTTITPECISFDIISITFNSADSYEILHLPDAF